MDESTYVPDAAAIRRALGECMTLDDIDEAMDWSAGTARRLRWHDRADGGLPPADAELGGVPLWFRATITRWRVGAAPVTDDEPVEDVEDAEEAEDAEDAAAPEADPDADAPDPDAEELGRPAGDEQTGPSPDTDVRPRTGFALSPGQDVLALVHGEWQPAVVASRDRRTVVVDYRVGPGPLGARRQRVVLDRVRLPDAAPAEDPGRRARGTITDGSAPPPAFPPTSPPRRA